ncbi:MAG: tRNA guanosine(15) transglycosylase TgtA [Candidatus Alkanophagales archaeon]
MFEVLHKDLMGRIGRLETPHGVVETPAIMPVVNPNLLLVRPDELEKFGAEIIITNAYIIHKKEELRERALEGGVHGLLGWKKPLMTDSGSYQLYEYGDVEVSNREIVEFQLEIGSDIVVPLDIPTPPDARRERAESDLSETLRRLREAKRVYEGRGAGDARGRGARPLLAGPIQGSTFLDLRERCAAAASETGFDVYPIGGLVPLLEDYRYRELVEIIVAVKRRLPADAPVHLFGVGHPIFFSLAVALGCDLFDSAAYALYARDDRYLTSDGTYFLEDLHYLPCSCPVCSKYDAKYLRECDREERTRLLAEHNLYVTFAEMRAVKQAIRENRLWELLERRCRAHPSLLSGLKKVLEHAELLERYDVATKRSFFYLGETSARRPEVLRYARRLDRFEVSGRALVAALGEDTSLEDACEALNIDLRAFDHVFLVKPPFGPYPPELRETYPIGQSEVPTPMDYEGLTTALENVLRLLEANRGAEFVFVCDEPWKEHPLIQRIRGMAKCIFVPEAEEVDGERRGCEPCP